MRIHPPIRLDKQRERAGMKPIGGMNTALVRNKVARSTNPTLAAKTRTRRGWGTQFHLPRAGHTDGELVWHYSSQRLQIFDSIETCIFGRFRAVPTGLRLNLEGAHPALKRGANHHCAYGADDRQPKSNRQSKSEKQPFCDRQPPSDRQLPIFLTGILFLCLFCLPACLYAQTAPPIPTPPQPAQAVELDRVVAVVNNQAILASDLDEEIRLAVLDPAQAGLGALTPRRALEQLISRALIQQQIRQEDAQAIEPTQAEIDARLSQIRKEVPACVHLNCASEEGWRAFLAAHALTIERVRAYLRFRIQILRFIEERFRQGIRITPEEIESYYKQTLLPQYAPGEAVPMLEEVSPRIQEILLQRQVNVLFDGWLTNLRKQGDVEVLDPALETPKTPGGAALSSPLHSVQGEKGGA